VAAVEMGAVMSGMQNLWHMTAQSAEDRMTALRQTYASERNGVPAPAAADTADGTSVWGKLSYGEFHRDNALSVNGLAYDNSYNQTMDGIETGIDHVVSHDADSTLVLGALLGYNTSRLNFKAGADKVRYTAWNFGVYASYVNGPWFANLLAKDDLTRVKFDFPGVPGIEKRDGNSFGGKLTAGGHFATDSIDLEPQASLAYVRSTLSDVDVPGSSFDFDSGTSLRGTLGLRLSTIMAQETTNFQPFIFAGVGNEFDAKNSVTMASGGSSVSIADKPIRSFGIASVGLNAFGEGGLSGFVKADGLFASHTNSFAFWAGLRFTQ
jgi:outer membrane autotransporter protein